VDGRVSVGDRRAGSSPFLASAADFVSGVCERDIIIDLRSSEKNRVAEIAASRATARLPHNFGFICQTPSWMAGAAPAASLGARFVAAIPDCRFHFFSVPVCDV
jgi:hypothetical protein